MTQGLQISMLMTGTELALKSDNAWSGDDSDRPGIMFGDILSDAAQPAKNSPANSALRQLPAGISVLSEISQAILGDVPLTDDINSEAAGALTASILGQIALKDRTLVAANAAAKPDVSAEDDTLLNNSEADVVEHLAEASDNSNELADEAVLKQAATAAQDAQNKSQATTATQTDKILSNSAQQNIAGDKTAKLTSDESVNIAAIDSAANAKANQSNAVNDAADNEVERQQALSAAQAQTNAGAVKDNLTELPSDTADNNTKIHDAFKTTVDRSELKQTLATLDGKVEALDAETGAEHKKPVSAAGLTATSQHSLLSETGKTVVSDSDTMSQIKTAPQSKAAQESDAAQQQRVQTSASTINERYAQPIISKTGHPEQVSSIKAEQRLTAVSTEQNAALSALQLTTEQMASETDLPLADTAIADVKIPSLTEQDNPAARAQVLNNLRDAELVASHSVGTNAPTIAAQIVKADVAGQAGAEAKPGNKAGAALSAEINVNLSAGNKASEQSAQQQNSQQQQGQHGGTAQIFEQLQTTAENHQHNAAKLTSEPVTPRQDLMFGSSLQAADLRQQAATQKSVAKSPAEQLKQSLNLQQTDAAGQLRERVNLMVRQNIQVAEIRLDPAGLGQMQIKIDMQQDQASVQFIVQQPQAKELLEQQLPRLREMLQQQGIALTEGNVQQQSQQQDRQMAQRDSQNGNSRSQQAGSDASDINGPSETVQITTSINERLVDYYA